MVRSASAVRELFDLPDRPAAGQEQAGDRFGSWTLVRELAQRRYVSKGKVTLHRVWLCRCKCGVEREQDLTALRTGASTQCRSCAGRAGKVEVSPGLRFESWTVIEEGPGAESVKPDGKSIVQRRFWCRCICGAKRLVALNGLRSGQSKQCRDCAAKKRKRSPARRWTKLTQRDAALRQVRRTYERTARERKLKFELSDAEFEALLAGNCTYCGAAPSNRHSVMTTAGRPYPGEQFGYNGIDRVDNDVGYVTGNCVSCCADCNRAKRKMELPQFVAYIIRAATHMRSRPELLALVNSDQFASAETEAFLWRLVGAQCRENGAAVSRVRKRRQTRSSQHDAQGKLLLP